MQALLVMLKTARIYLTKNFFPCMSKGCMSQVMAKRYRLCQVFIQAQGPCNGPRYLGDLNSVRQARPVMITLWSKEHLCFMNETPEGLCMNNPVPVPLETCTNIVFPFISLSAPAL